MKNKKQGHCYTIHDYMGKNNIGKDCHIYELHDNGECIYRLNSLILSDGTEKESAIKLFYDRAERIMDETAEDIPA